MKTAASYIIDNHKIFESDDYNYDFNLETGQFMRWGTTYDDDPEWSFRGPEILDVEVSTICHGTGNPQRPCRRCYKTNSPKGINMSLDTFKQVISKVPKGPLTQVALGIGDYRANSDLTAIMWHCRRNNIIPNITINGYGMDISAYHELASVAGAVAVSNYDRDVCYEAVEELNRARRAVACDTLRQVNIHQLLSENTLSQCWQLMLDMQKDPRLKDLNAAVFLLLKPKGKRNDMVQLKNMKRYKELVDYALNHGLSIGFDSCGAGSFLRAVEGRDNYEQLEQAVEPCESTCFSAYISADAMYFPCSFCEGESGFEPINMLEVEDFLADVWNAPQTVSFRDKLLKNNRQCPVWDLEIK